MEALTRNEVWNDAIGAGDRSMRSAGRITWNDHDWRAMIAEFDHLSPPLELMPTALIRAEVNRRLPHKPKTLRPCAYCGAMLGTRERRLPCSNCGKRNPRK